MDSEDREDVIVGAKGSSSSGKAAKKAGAWHAFGLCDAVLRAIQKKGFRQPTPIQRKAIPYIMDGRDLVAMSRTGSGKTGAFLIPLLNRLKQRDPKGVRALILSPTRELALQTFQVCKELGRYTGLRCAAIVGGESMESQFATIHENPDILIATPGRLLHLVVEMQLRLSAVSIVVFDEADRLFEMGLAEQLHETLRRIPEARQTLLFSATLPRVLVDFTKAGLSNPTLVRLDVDEKISPDLSMSFLIVRAEDKLAAVLQLVKGVISRSEQALVFCATMKHVEWVGAVLERAGIQTALLYSQLDAIARKRSVERFRNRDADVLVVTDVAARGVDIPLLDNAINMHFPPQPKLFVHRVGRVARAGRAGHSISLVAVDELAYLNDLFLFLGRPIVWAKPGSVYDPRDVLVGRFPQTLVDLEADFLRATQEADVDIVDLSEKAQRAMIKYRKTRPAPAAASARRSKTELRASAIAASDHPFLAAFATSESVKAASTSAPISILQAISSYKPHQTVLEMRSVGTTEAAAAMRAVRKVHRVSRQVPRHDGGQETAAPVSTAEVTPADNADLASAFSTVVGATRAHAAADAHNRTKKRKRLEEKENGESAPSKKRRADQMKEQRDKFYVAYQPPDAAAEQALAITKGSFYDQARVAVFDLCADDEKGLYKAGKKKRVWDRKKKKYVAADGSDDPTKKWIRTEDGTRLPASYRSGRYDLWKKRQHIAAMQAHNDEDGGDQPTARKGPHPALGRGRRGRAAQERSAPREGGVRSVDQIVKGRKKKQSVQSYQTYRRKENEKRKQPARS